MADSIIQNGRYCYQCGRENIPLELHHCLNNQPNRKLSDKYGLTVYLCPECHRNVHAEYGLREHLKQTAQRQAMKTYGWTLDEWREIFGKNYL